MATDRSRDARQAGAGSDQFEWPPPREDINRMFVRVDPAADEAIPSPAPPAPPAPSVPPAAASSGTSGDEPLQGDPDDDIGAWPPDPVPLDAWPAEPGVGAEGTDATASPQSAVQPTVTSHADATAAGSTRSAEPSVAPTGTRQRRDVPPADARPAAMVFDPLPARPVSRSSAAPVVTELPTDWDVGDWSPGRATRPAPPPSITRRAAFDPKMAAALAVLLALAIALPWFLLRDQVALTGAPTAVVAPEIADATAARPASTPPPAAAPPEAEPMVPPPAPQEAPPAASTEGSATDDLAPTERPVPAPSTTPPPQPEPRAPVPARSTAPPPEREPPAPARDLRAEVRPREPSRPQPAPPAPPPSVPPPTDAAAAAARQGLQRSAASTAPAPAPPVTAPPFQGAPVVVEDAPPLKLPPPEAEAARPEAAPAAASAPKAAAPPAPSVPTDEQLVSATLQRYAMAYQQLDAGAAQKVWPRVDLRALARAFETLESQQVNFDSCRVRVQGRTATADCAGSVTYVPKVGRKDPRTVERRWDFALQKRTGAWQITRAMTR